MVNSAQCFQKTLRSAPGSMRRWIQVLDSKLDNTLTLLPLMQVPQLQRVTFLFTLKFPLTRNKNSPFH